MASLHLCLGRFPQHYKSLYRLAFLYTHSRTHRVSPRSSPGLAWAGRLGGGVARVGGAAGGGVVRVGGAAGGGAARVGLLALCSPGGLLQFRRQTV